MQLSQQSRMVVEYGTWDFVQEPGRDQIHKWRTERLKKLDACRSHMLFHFTVFNLEILHSFALNINFMVLLQMLLAGLSVYIFQLLKVSVDINVCLFVSPIVFPLAFCINTDFQRREKVLEDLASFKSAAMVWYFCMRDWKDGADLDDGWLRAVQSKVKSVLFHLQEYLLTARSDRRKVILSALYEDFSDINQLIEKVRVSKLPANTAIISRSIHLLRTMCLAFERLRVVREYRSPRSIRSFNKVFIMFLPIILAPYFVHVGIQSKSSWQPYCIAILIAFVFSALQGAQDKLDDPFDGMSEDDINMDTIDELNCSLQRIMTRTFAIGHFRISMDLPKVSPKPFRRRRSSKSSSVFDSNNGIGRSSMRGKPLTRMRSRLNTFSNSELDSMVSSAAPSKEKVLRTHSNASCTPRYLTSISTESGASNGTLVPPVSFKSKLAVNENKNGCFSDFTNDLVKLAELPSEDAEQGSDQDKLIQVKNGSINDGYEGKSKEHERDRGDDLENDVTVPIHKKPDISYEKIRRVSFGDGIGPKLQITEETEEETSGKVDSSDNEANRELCGNLERANIHDNISPIVEYPDDFEDDFEICDDDEEERELIISEWEKVEAVLRTEIFETNFT